MPRVRIERKRVWVDETPLALLSGEIHFWRMNPSYWRKALRQMRDLGLRIAASYVCWEFHELEAGRFDFRGATDPAHNLTGFLDMVVEEGLWLLIRPGPYIYGEWVNGGVPDRAARYHRLHSQFQEAASTYMAAVVDTVKPYLATQGGPVILFQAENEPDPWPHIYETQLGLGQDPGIFQDFLRQRYGEINVLNAAWETQLPDFDQARAITHPAIQSRGYLNRYLDFCRFRHWYTGEVVRWTATGYRQLGVDVPVFANTYVSNGIQNWREIEQTCDLCGPDLYPTNEFRQSPDELGQFLLPLRYTRSYSVLPYIPEFQAGIWHGGQDYTGLLTPNHYLMACCAALLAGVAGWNWYMLVSRDNWLMSPVNEWGNPRPDLFQVFAQVVRLFDELDPPDLEKLTATAVTTEPLHQTARLEDRSRQLMAALHQADIDYECYDLETGQITAPLLFYAGGDWLSWSNQERLLKYVELGGNLVFFQDLPVKDETLSSRNCLDLRQPEGVLDMPHHQRLKIKLGAYTVAAHTPAVFSYTAIPGESILAERDFDDIASGEELRLHLDLPVGTQYTIGYRERRGKGNIVCLGVSPIPALLTAIHDWLDVPVYSQAQSPQVSTALFHRDRIYYLIAVNNGEEERAVSVKIRPEIFDDGLWTVEDLLTGQEYVANLSVDGRLWLHIDRKSGTALRMSRSEREQEREEEDL